MYIKPFYVVIHKGPRIGCSFYVKSNAKHNAKVSNAIGIVKINSSNALRYDKQEMFKPKLKGE